MPKVGGKRKKTRTHVVENEEYFDEVPKSMVLKRTAVNKDTK